MSDEEVGGSSITNRISIQSVVPLEADSTYWLYVQDQTGGSREVTFSTGSEQAEVIDEAPTGTITSLSYEHERNAETGTWRATVILDHHPVDSGLSILRVTDSRTPQVIIDETWATSSGTVTWELEWWGAEEEELCLEITQEDEAGRDSEPSNEICSEAEISRTSCSSAAIGSVGSWWLLAGLVGLARRRRAS